MAEDRDTKKKKAYLIMGVIISLLVLLGLFVYLFDKATRLDSPSQIQNNGNLVIVVTLVGLALVGTGGAFSLSTLWKGQPKPFIYDVGLRLVATGYVASFVSALADYIGMGSHHKLPYFGPLQTAGVFLGEAVIAIGFLMMFFSHKHE
jgi:hypothetical protein